MTGTFLGGVEFMELAIIEFMELTSVEFIELARVLRSLRNVNSSHILKENTRQVTLVYASE